jgi:hypothetical protein
VVAAAAKQQRKHQPEDLIQQCRDRVQSPLNLLRQYLGQVQVTQRLLQGLQMPLSTGLLVPETLARLLEVALLRLICSSLGVCHGGHGLLLSCSMVCVEETMAQSIHHFKSFHVVFRLCSQLTEHQRQTGKVR